MPAYKGCDVSNLQPCGLKCTNLVACDNGLFVLSPAINFEGTTATFLAVFFDGDAKSFLTHMLLPAW
jgi:hypothetical protein